MSTYQIVFQPAAAREYRKLPPDIRPRIQSALQALATNPRPSGVKKLTGSENRWRIRVGDYRIIYRIEDGVLQVIVLRIAHRRNVYR